MTTVTAAETVRCPGCDGARGETIFREVWADAPVEIRICAACGLGYSTPRPSEASKLAYYAESSTQTEARQAHYDHRQQLRHFGLYRRVMRLIEARAPRGRLLDVGCAGGLFLVFADVYASDHHSGTNGRYSAEGAAFDPREGVLARAISGAPVWLTPELSGLDAGRYDAITLLNVLEHVNEPIVLLRELRRLLRPGGVLVVVVPNNELLFWRLRHHLGARPTTLMAGEHLNHFRPASLGSLLARAGFPRLELVAGQAAGSYGSIARPPVRQYVKHGAYRALQTLTASRWYLYAEMIVLAE